ncbi:MAG: protein kinase [Terriglobales bacterium]|jgi:tetratricopeptide (TPR) repeat protein
MNLNLMAILNPGTVLGGRYEILQMLGLGGMGAVYKAQDRELDRTIALKVIRPDLASNPEALARFKQELLTARQVTHRNVIRIFDIGEADGIKFITMEYLVGTDLRALLAERGKLPPEEAMEIIQQVCAGLAAAHSEGIIHRDLKPGNIMHDSQGRVVVMDFGLARSLQSDGMTQTGAMLGTVEYMSPEQARAEKLDGRSDIFTIGLILYELLTRKMPFKADSAIASLLKRTQERAAPVTELDPTISHSLSELVAKCLEREPSHRFQSAQEMFDRIDEIRGRRPASVYPPTPAVAKPPESRQFTFALPVMSRARWAGAIAAILVVAVAIGALVLRGRFKAAGPGSGKPVTVLVADFSNHTGDPVFDGTLEPMFNVAMEGASFINAYSRGDARRLASKLPHPTDKLDEQSARLIAISQGLGAIVTGSLSRRGDGYKVSVEAMDAVSGNTIASAEASAATKDEVLTVIPKLAAPIRKALGDTTPESEQLNKAGGTFTAASLEVVHQYSIALDQQFAGKVEEALKSFAKAAELDPNFARAYSGMGAMARNLGKQQDGEKYIKLAMEHENRLTDRERYRVRGVYYMGTANWQKCVEEYRELVKLYPADNIGYTNLSACYTALRNIPKAVEAAQRAVEIVPQGGLQHLVLSFYSSYGGDFQGGEREARAALDRNPSYGAYLALAEAQVGQGQLSQAAETYHKLETVSALGASIAASGLADLASYEGSFERAVRLLEQGAAADLAAKRPENAADKFAALANTQLLRGQKGAAVVAAEKALANSQSVQVRFLAAQAFLEAGEMAKAQKLAAGLGSELQAEPQAYAKIIAGKSALKRGDARQAIKDLTEANTLLDTWIGRFELGRVYLEAGQFVEADSEFDRCIKRRGEALELFMDNVATYAYFPPVYYYQGRVREGLKSPGFAESYRTYLSIRGQTGEDPLVPEVRRRLGQ